MTSTKQKSFSEIEARGLLVGIEILISTRGKSIVTVNLKRDKPEWGDLSKLILGPTGKARAPLVRKGKTLIVGFSHDAYLDGLK